MGDRRSSCRAVRNRRQASLRRGSMTRCARTTPPGRHPLENIEIIASDLVTSRIGLGTWAIGGWMWGGTDEAESIRAIRAALDLGITLIDTAPAYGFGRSEELVGQ